MGDNRLFNGPMTDHTPQAESPPTKQRGLRRIWHALGYSLQGLKAGWLEPAFRQEALAALVLLPLSLFVGQGWVETALLSGSVLLVLIVELLNTGIESITDRVSSEWHALSKRAKDMGSAAVLLSLLFCTGIWLTAILNRFLA